LVMFISVSYRILKLKLCINIATCSSFLFVVPLSFATLCPAVASILPESGRGGRGGGGGIWVCFHRDNEAKSERRAKGGRLERLGVGWVTPGHDS